MVCKIIKERLLGSQRFVQLFKYDFVPISIPDRQGIEEQGVQNLYLRIICFGSRQAKISKHFSKRVFTASSILKTTRFNVLFQPALHGTGSDVLVQIGYIDMGKSASCDKKILIVRDNLSDYRWFTFFLIQLLRSLLVKNLNGRQHLKCRTVSFWMARVNSVMI